MKISIKVDGDVAKICADETSHAAKAVTSAFRIGGDRLKQRGRAEIGRGGFSSRWQNAFRVNIYPKSGASLHPKIFAFHKISYAGQFEDPQPVVGSPYVWLPIDKNLPGGQRWTPDKYTKQIGPLRSGRKGSRPLLFGQISVNRSAKPVKLARKGGLSGKAVRKIWLPVFVGVSMVNDPKRFDLKSQTEAAAGDISDIFSKEFGANG